MTKRTSWFKRAYAARRALLLILAAAYLAVPAALTVASFPSLTSLSTILRTRRVHAENDRAKTPLSFFTDPAGIWMPSVVDQGPWMESVNVTIDTAPSGLAVTVDAVVYTAPQTFRWTVNSTHSISADSPQEVTPDTRYVWSSWNDGGDRTHTVTVSEATVFIASFTKQYLLTMEPSFGLTLTPPTGFFDAGVGVELFATTSNGFCFPAHWQGTGNGSYTGPGNPVHIQMNGPITERNIAECHFPTATATSTATSTPTPTATEPPPPVAITINTLPTGLTFTADGVSFTAPSTFQWTTGSEHTISADSPQQPVYHTQYVWNGWSDGGPRKHAIVIDGEATYTASFDTQYLLTISGGSPPTGFFAAGSSVQIVADPCPPFANFWGWFGIGNGSYSGLNPIGTVTMNEPIMETAICEGPNPPTPTPTPRSKQFDYDGDRVADISVFRPSDATWYLEQSTAGFFAPAMGQATDNIAPADYDGDGKTDIAVYRPEEGVWYILASSDRTYLIRRFGMAEDLPAAADYDGDGRADIALFRPSDGTWYISHCGGAGCYTIFQYGQDGDRPTVGDFDGDGLSDIAVFRPSDRSWYHYRSSGGGSRGETFGLADDKVVPADYDGDGKTDLAVYRVSEGMWYIKNSASGTYSAVRFGLAEDIPVPADYDGDGRADIAVFRPSDGTWYISNSVDGSYTIRAFGLAGDIPTQSAYGN